LKGKRGKRNEEEKGCRHRSFADPVLSPFLRGLVSITVAAMF